MAVSVISTQKSTDFWSTSEEKQQNPPTETLTIPANTDKVAVLWSYYDGSGTESGTATLDSNSPTQTLTENPGVSGTSQGHGAWVWDVSTSGSMDIDISWGTTPDSGTGDAFFAVYYLQDSADGNVNAFDGDAGTSQSDAISASVATTSGGIVLRHETRWTTQPAVESTWTAGVDGNTSSGSYNGNGSYKAGTGSTVTATGQSVNYSSVYLVSIDEAGSGGGATGQTLMMMGLGN